MSRLSQIVRQKATITVQIDGTDDSGNAIKVPIQVTYLPRRKTLAWQGRFADHLQALQRFEEEAKAATERGASQTELADMAEKAKVEEHANAMGAMTLELLDSWDLTDEDDDGNTVAVPLPKTTEAVSEFPAPELFESVMREVMAALNPNRKAGETTEQPSPAT